MLSPEAYHIENKHLHKDDIEKAWQNKSNKISVEGTGGIEINSYKNPKTWKKSISNFFRYQLRSTKSNDGDRTYGNKEKYTDKEISPDQKWQSLGKIFRRQSFEQWSKGAQQGECSSSNKRLAVKKVLSSYFGKKSPSNDNN